MQIADGDLDWAEFLKLMPSLVGGIIQVDDSSAYEHVAVVEQIFLDEMYNLIRVVPVAGTVRTVMSDDDSHQTMSDRFDPGWSANIDYTSVSVHDGVFAYGIPQLGQIFLYPPGHPEIRQHWMPVASSC